MATGDDGPRSHRGARAARRALGASIWLKHWLKHLAQAFGSSTWGAHLAKEPVTVNVAAAASVASRTAAAPAASVSAGYSRPRRRIARRSGAACGCRLQSQPPLRDFLVVNAPWCQLNSRAMAGLYRSLFDPDAPSYPNPGGLEVLTYHSRKPVARYRCPFGHPVPKYGQKNSENGMPARPWAS